MVDGRDVGVVVEGRFAAGRLGSVPVVGPGEGGVDVGGVLVHRNRFYRFE